MSSSIPASHISLLDAPEDVYGKVMSVDDACMLDYIDILSSGQWPELEADATELRAGGGAPMPINGPWGWFAHARFVASGERGQVAPNGGLYIAQLAAGLDLANTRSSIPVCS